VVVTVSTENVNVHGQRFEVTLDRAESTALYCVAVDEPLELHRRDLGTIASATATLHGLLADTDYLCTIEAGTGAQLGTWSETIHTPPDGNGLPNWTVEGDPDAVWGAYTITMQWSAIATYKTLTIFDPQGRVRWTYPMPSEVNTGIEVTVWEGAVLVGGADFPPELLDLDRQSIWKIPNAPIDSRYHHEAHPTAHGTLLTLREDLATDGNIEWLGFAVEEWDLATLERMWLWTSQMAVDAGTLPPGVNDAWHPNAVSWVDDALGSGVMVGLAKGNRVIRIDQATNEIVWTLGVDSTDFALQSGDWFYFAHDPELTGNRILMHDNGWYRPSGDWSRLVEYELDFVAGTANLVWDWRVDGWFQKLWGDADRLPDGLVFATRGNCANCTIPEGQVSDIQAINSTTDEVVWRLFNEDPNIAIYRADRVGGCEIFDNTRYCTD
jgi:hypothetical protein